MSLAIRMSPMVRGPLIFRSHPGIVKFVHCPPIGVEGFGIAAFLQPVIGGPLQCNVGCYAVA
jgi:hypothetical protein